MKTRLQILSLVFLFLSACKHNYSLQKTEHAHLAISSEISNHKKSSETITPYRNQLKNFTEEFLVVSAAEFTKAGDQTTLGNFVCDALKNFAEKNLQNQQVDMVIVNRGGLRANLPEGDIKVYNIFELMPFDNNLVVVSINGKELAAFADLITIAQPAYLGATIELEKKKVIRFEVGENKLIGEKIYSVLTSDFLLNGGDNFNFLKKNESVNYTGILLRDAIIDYCREMQKLGKQLIPYTDGRLQISE